MGNGSKVRHQDLVVRASKDLKPTIYFAALSGYKVAFIRKDVMFPFTRLAGSTVLFLAGFSSSPDAFSQINAFGMATIVTQPKSAITEAGVPVMFSCVATGSGSLAFQWYFQGAPLSGATGSSFTLGRPMGADAGR